MRPMPGAWRWLSVPVRLFELLIVISVLGVLILAFDLIENEPARGQYITVLVLTLVTLAAAFVGRNALINDARAGRPVTMGVAGVLIIGLFDLLSTIKVALTDPAWTGFGVEAYLFASLVYFLFCLAMSLYSRRLEHRPPAETHRLPEPT
jgi:hypothetical protein